MRIGKEIGIVSDKAGQLEVQQDQFDKALQDYNQQMQEAQSRIAPGGSAVQQFVDASGNQTYKNPVEIRAVNSEGSLRFSNHGLGFFSPNGNTRTVIRSDGKINAEKIDTGVVKALNVQSLVVNISVVTRIGGSTLTVGAINETLPPSVSGVIAKATENNNFTDGLMPMLISQAKNSGKLTRFYYFARPGSWQVQADYFS